MIAARRYAPYVLKNNRYARAARAGIALGKFAYQNRAYITKAYNAMRARRKSKSKFAKRSMKQKRTNPFVTSYTPSAQTLQDMTQKTFYSGAINYPAQGLGTTDRRGEQIFVSGVNICLHVRSTVDYPQILHFALIQLPSDQLTQQQFRDQFFRADGPSSSITLDFVNQSIDPNWDLRYDCNKINPDNKAIITHRRWLLDKKFVTNPSGEPSVQPFGQGQSMWAVKMDKYFAIKRPVKFSGTGVIPEKPLYWCMWIMALEPQDQVSDASTTAVYNVREKLYFRNIN